MNGVSKLFTAFVKHGSLFFSKDREPLWLGAPEAEPGPDRLHRFVPKVRRTLELHGKQPKVHWPS